MMTSTMIPGCTGYRQLADGDDPASGVPCRNRKKTGPGVPVKESEENTRARHLAPQILRKTDPGLEASSEDR
jgi:hypothetical protein